MNTFGLKGNGFNSFWLLKKRTIEVWIRGIDFILTVSRNIDSSLAVNKVLNFITKR